MRSLERCSATVARGLITWQKSTMVFRLRELWLTPKQLRSYGHWPFSTKSETQVYIQGSSVSTVPHLKIQPTVDHAKPWNLLLKKIHI